MTPLRRLALLAGIAFALIGLYGVFTGSTELALFGTVISWCIYKLTH